MFVGVAGRVLEHQADASSFRVGGAVDMQCPSGVRVRSVPGCRIDFVIGLASGSRKLLGLRRPEAVVALRRAGFPGLGSLVTPFTGVPPGEPIAGETEESLCRDHERHRVGCGSVCASLSAVVSVRSWSSGIGRNPRVRLGKSIAGVVEHGSGGGSTGARAHIVGVVDHPYLATWLPLWLTMLSHTSTMPAVLAVGHASMGKGVGLTCVRPVGRTTAGAPILAPG
ncbi:hypothetical protein B296_00015026 [Ensete ventricosum]|uniref:Uncharacterized protein n=1 Tax=Ensete ventricosum TaxID=4639 RepID=A0A427AUJ3_ENSVE|nr:hypothetical protein B296_00015026 [Ensete ventricosum]